MERLSLKQVAAVFLVLVVAGAVSVCLVGVAAASQKTHDMSSDPNVSLSHLVHVKELTSAAVASPTMTSLALVIFLSLAVFATFALAPTSNLFLQHAPLTHFGKRRDVVPRAAQLAIYRWLSLFENSPSFLKPA
ncbi:MAG: hypothetical protein HY978_00550 [Candidatus Liptonbacteria bacterium]|nr:hypothetical protein [Candidatus Liptonbacteria bacterium]